MSAREVTLGAPEAGVAPESSATRDLGRGKAGPSVVLPLGRAASVLLSAGIFVFLDGTPTSRPVTDRLQVLVLIAAIMSVCLQFSFSMAHPVLGRLAPTLTGALGGLVATGALALLLPAVEVELTALLATTLGICVLVPLVDRLLELHILGRRRVLVFGSGESAASLERELRSSVVPYQIAGLWERNGSWNDPAEIILACKPHMIVDASPPSPNEPEDSHNGVMRIGDFYEHAVGRVLPDGLVPERLAAVSRRSGYERVTTRAFDMVVAALGFVVTAPLWLVLVLLVRMTEGAIFIRQQRVGEGGRLFTMYKFRTMRLDAEAFGEARWADASDARVTFAGRFLRQTHLDELPQLWNVLKGEMSIVGPRPERPELTPMLEDAIPNWNCRLLVKPGLTGWAQVRLGYASDCATSERKLSYDLWYVENQSLMVDAAVCLRTLPTLLPSSPRRANDG